MKADALLTDGYLARTFGRDTASQHFYHYLKRHIESLDVQYDEEGRCYFLRANSLGYPHPTTRLDHYAEAPHLVVPQAYWLARTPIDFDRYVWAPQLSNTIFFGPPGVGRGLSVTNAVAGNCLGIPVNDRQAYFSPVAKASTQIRVLVGDTRLFFCCRFSWPAGCCSGLDTQSYNVKFRRGMRHLRRIPSGLKNSSNISAVQ